MDIIQDYLDADKYFQKSLGNTLLFIPEITTLM